MKTLKEISAGIFGAVLIWVLCWFGAIADYLINGVK